MWLIDINRTSHRMISVEIKRKAKASSKVLKCKKIPYEGFEESLHKYIALEMTPHVSLVATLRDLVGLGRRFKPIPEIHPYDQDQHKLHPM